MFHCLPDSAEPVQGSENLFGHIWVQVDDFVFPAESWGDMVLPIFGWWCECLSGLRLGAKVEFLFMNGPYSIVAQTNSGSVNVGFRQNEHLVHSSVVGFDRFHESLGYVIKKYSRVCSKNNMPEAADRLSKLHKEYFERSW